MPKPNVKPTVFGKPQRPLRCTVQIVETTDYLHPVQAGKFTVYADPKRVHAAITRALADLVKS